MIDHLEADLTHCRNREPLSVIRNMPGEGVELNPQQIRALALALLQLADECERRKYDSKQLKVKRIIVPI